MFFADFWVPKTAKIFRQAQTLSTSASKTYVCTYVERFFRSFFRKNEMCLFFGLENGEETFRTQNAKWISTFWSYSCARFHLSMCTLSLEHVHASSWLYACFEHVHASTWACACFHWSMCILPLGYMHTYTWTYVCFQLSLCMLSLEHGCVFSWVCARFHLSLYRLTF